MNQSAIRPAATIILLRHDENGPRVLMGQRGQGAAFMPGKFVFPGGAVDRGDGLVAPETNLDPICASRLGIGGSRPESFAIAAIRELWEETGLRLGTRANWPDPPAEWRLFAQSGHRPAAHPLRFIFRAITPPGNQRRFDARFFLADAAHLASDPDDFAGASDELRYLQWIPLAKAQQFDLPFITEIVLTEVAALLCVSGPPPSVPFFDNATDQPRFCRL